MSVEILPNAACTVVRKINFKRLAIDECPRSFKVIGNYTIAEAIYYFLLVVRGNNVSILQCSEISPLYVTACDLNNPSVSIAQLKL